MTTPLSTGVSGDHQAVAAVEEQFRLIFTRARAALREHAERIHPALQPVGYKIVDMLARRGPLHAREVAEYLAIDKSLVSRTVKQLEELGLVSRRSDPDDGRACFLEVTHATRQRVAEVRAADQRLLQERMAEWSPGQVVLLAELLEKLNETFQT